MFAIPVIIKVDIDKINLEKTNLNGWSPGGISTYWIIFMSEWKLHQDFSHQFKVW